MSDRRELEEIEAKLSRIEYEIYLLQGTVWQILNLLIPRPTGGVIDILGDHVSTQVGTTSNFQWAYTPTGSVPPGGTTLSWTCDVADVALTPSADGFTCQAAVPATETSTAYNLTCTSSFVPAGAPTPISFTLNVPITPAVILPTGGVITQTS